MLPDCNISMRIFRKYYRIPSKSWRRERYYRFKLDSDKIPIKFGLDSNWIFNLDLLYPIILIGSGLDFGLSQDQVRHSVDSTWIHM